MDFALLAVQILNGLDLGFILFLVASGLTLVFGVMDFINLAHGVQYMLGAYFAAALIAWSGSFWLGLVLGAAASLAMGLVLEWTVFRHLARVGHLEQVLATFALILIFTDGVSMIFGAGALSINLPASLAQSVPLAHGFSYPLWRLIIIAAGLGVALLLWALIAKTRLGMLVRAGSTHPQTVQALGVDIDRLFLMVFAFGAMLAGFAGTMAGALTGVEPTMGDSVLILAFVVIVVGGVGSVRGALIAALLIGLVDTLGRAFATDIMGLFLSRSSAASAGPALASMLIYVLMALVLAVRPSGLFASGD